METVGIGLGVKATTGLVGCTSMGRAAAESIGTLTFNKIRGTKDSHITVSTIASRTRPSCETLRNPLNGRRRVSASFSSSDYGFS